MNETVIVRKGKNDRKTNVMPLCVRYRAAFYL